MPEVVANPLQRLERDEWWAVVRDALDELSGFEAADNQLESQQLDTASADGLVDPKGK